MSAIRASTRGPQPESSFGEVEADSRIASDAVEVAPDNMGSIHATLHDEIFDEPAQVVPRQSCHHCGALAPALAHGARDIILATALPHLKAARTTHASGSGIEAQHHLAHGRAIPSCAGGRSNLQDVIAHELSGPGSRGRVAECCESSFGCLRSPA